MELPTLSEYEQSIVEYWYTIGTVQQTSGGLAPLAWQEIVAWANHFRKELVIEWVEHPKPSEDSPVVYSPIVIERCSLVDWELEQIRMLSQEYTAEYSQTSPQRECPKQVFIEDVSEDTAIANAEEMEKALKNLFGKS